MSTKSTSKTKKPDLVRICPRVPLGVADKLDRTWHGRAAKGAKETKQAFVTLVIETGLQNLPKA